MDELEQLIRQYLPTVNIMQLATAKDDQPWACTVHYYSDDRLNLYWISTEQRRHSQELAHNQKAAAAIVVHENTPVENYITGLSIEGVVTYLGTEIDPAIAEAYVNKLRKPPHLLPDIMSGKNPHKFYCLKPSIIVLFDPTSFPDQPRQEWRSE